MNRRERVLKSIRHEEPDFVPYNFHAAATVYKKVQDYYHLPSNEAVVDFAGNHVVKIGSDFNVNPWAKGIKAELIPSGGPIATAIDNKGGLHTDEFGCVWDRSGGMPHPVRYPLSEDPSLLNKYEFPDPYHEGRFDNARILAERYRGEVFMFGKLGMTLFERAWSIRGMEELLLDMAVRPEFVEELLDRIVYEWNLPIIDQQLALGVDGFYFADDWGSKQSLLFSPEMWRHYIKPRLAVCYDRVKEAGAFIGQHSDGNILVIFPDLIEIGMDIFNPVQPSVYDPNQLKKDHGDQVTFYGGIDVETTLPFGSPDDVRHEMLDRVEHLGARGGYILQSSHTILEDVPLKNVIAFIETCHELAGINTDEAAERIRSAASSVKG